MLKRTVLLNKESQVRKSAQIEKTSLLAEASLNFFCSQHIHLCPPSPQWSHTSWLLRLMWSHYSFVRSIYFAISLNETLPFRNRSGGRNSSGGCLAGILIPFLLMYLQLNEKCRWCIEEDNLCELPAFMKKKKTNMRTAQK